MHIWIDVDGNNLPGYESTLSCIMLKNGQAYFKNFAV